MSVFMFDRMRILIVLLFYIWIETNVEADHFVIVHMNYFSIHVKE